MVASTVPTSTVSPTSTASDATRPLAGDGHSVSTLSVEISTFGSSHSALPATLLFLPPAAALLPLDDRPLGHRHAHLGHRDLDQRLSRRGAHGTPPRCRSTGAGSRAR